MKKCASCTKDLPDAALHCVFCGAKQSPAPVGQPGLAKTVMGYSPNEMIEQMRAQGVPPGTPGARPAPGVGPFPQPASGPFPQPAPANLPAAGPFPQPKPPSVQGYSPTPGPAYVPPNAPNAPIAANAPFVPPTMAPTMVPGNAYVAPQPAQSRGFAQPMGSNAPTMMVTTDQANPGMQATMAPGPMTPPAPAYQPPPAPPVIAPAPAVPIMPQRHVATPTSPVAARAGRPIEPWKDTLRLLMMVWGGLLLLAFATPLSTDPLSFNWNLIIDGEGVAKVPALLLAAIGLLSIVVGMIPMTPAPRGIMAALLGLGGIATPLVIVMATADMPPWQVLVTLAGSLLIVPGLVMRQEYRSSILPRIFVTLGVLAYLAPLLVPQNDTIPLVGMFNKLIDGEGLAKVSVAVDLAFLAIIVLSLLVWLPAPATGGAKVFAWLFILWALIDAITKLVVAGHIGDVVPKSPNAALMAWAPISAYLVLFGYGLATAVGKQLE